MSGVYNEIYQPDAIWRKVGLEQSYAWRRAYSNFNVSPFRKKVQVVACYTARRPMRKLTGAHCMPGIEGKNPKPRNEMLHEQLLSVSCTQRCMNVCHQEQCCSRKCLQFVMNNFYGIQANFDHFRQKKALVRKIQEEDKISVLKHVVCSLINMSHFFM